MQFPRLAGRRSSSWYLTLFTVQHCEEGKSTTATAKGSGQVEEDPSFSPQAYASQLE